MSTRSVIIVKDSNNNKKQFYHHHDGYPSYMGEHLKEYLLTSNSAENEKDKDKKFFDCLEIEGSFIEEVVGEYHGDIEYCWYVNLGEIVENSISYNTYDVVIDPDPNDLFLDKGIHGYWRCED